MRPPKAQNTSKKGRRLGSGYCQPGKPCGARKWLAKRTSCTQIDYVKTVTYPIRIPKGDYQRVVAEAKRRRKSVADLFRDLITYGLPALPPIPETYEALQEVWDSLGPPPEILYDKLAQER